MPTHEGFTTTEEFYAAIAAKAAALAAIEVITWIPMEHGDRMVGKIVESGTIELPSLRVPGEFDVWPTSTVQPMGDTIMQGEKVDLNGQMLRIAWLGPVQLSYYQSARPDDGDVVAMHYQRDETPKSGLNDYKLVNCVVFDGTTGKPKKPVVLDRFGADRLTLPSNVNARTGEIASPAFEPFNESNEKLNEPAKPGKKS